jgi:NAD kinase
MSIKIALLGKHGIEKIIRKIKEHELEIDFERPDIALAYGGDGTVLYAARKYSEIPLLGVRSLDSLGFLTNIDEEYFDKALERIKKGDYSIKEETKIEATSYLLKYNKVVRLEALNEIQIRTKFPTRASKDFVMVNGNYIFVDEKEKHPSPIISDGIVVSTPCGSTGYFASLIKAQDDLNFRSNLMWRKKLFEEGIGIAINNPHLRQKNYEIVPEDSKILLLHVAADCYLACDNDEKNIYEVIGGDRILIRKSPNKAKFIYFKD